MEYFEKNIFIKKKFMINILYYLVLIKYNFKYFNKYECEKLFNCLKRCFFVDEGNVDGKILLYVVIKEDLYVLIVLNFLRISEKCINKVDFCGEIVLYLVLNFDKVD